MQLLFGALHAVTNRARLVQLVRQRGVRRAEEQITIGETMDFEFTAPAGGAFGLEVRTAAGVLVVRQPFTIAPR